MTPGEIVAALLVVADELREHQSRIEALAGTRRQLVVQLHGDHGWSDRRIAEAVGVSRQMVGKIRAGR